MIDCNNIGRNDKLDFGEALAFMRDGYRVTRNGWNGKGMWIELVIPTNGWEPFILMHTALGKEQPGWLASQNDMLATDWETC